MKKIITPFEAAIITAASDAWKDDLIDRINKEITEQAEKGLKRGHFPGLLSEPEIDWLTSELVIAGYTVRRDSLTFTW